MYEAAASPVLWPAALEKFATGVQAGGASLMLCDKRTADFSGFLGGSVYTPDYLALYTSYYHRLDPLYKSASAAPTSESVMLCQEFVHEETVAKSEYYQDFLIPNQLRYRAGWHLESSPDRLIALGLHKDKTRFERSDLRTWESVARHARQAARLTLKIGPLLAQGELLRQAIDHKQMNCIMVDSNARVLDCSTAASTLLESGKVLRLGHRSQLATHSREETARLRILVVSAATSRTAGTMRLAGHWTLQVVPCGVAQQNPFDPRFARCALVFVNSPQPPMPIDWKLLQLTLDCTRAEAEVAADLACGIAPKDIAAKRNVSLNTVRTQIRALLERTRRHRVSELIIFLSTQR
jgi:DNA-binding CsgD family transcriptional regulator